MRFDCIHCRKATTKPQSVKGAFLRMLTALQLDDILLLAKEDAMGKALQDLGLKTRKGIQKGITYNTYGIYLWA